METNNTKPVRKPLRLSRYTMNHGEQSREIEPDGWSDYSSCWTCSTFSCTGNSNRCQDCTY